MVTVVVGVLTLGGHKLGSVKISHCWVAEPISNATYANIGIIAQKNAWTNMQVHEVVL